MGFFSWVLVGAIAGAIAGRLMKAEKMGCFVNIVVGIIGGILGGLIVSILGGTGVTGFNLWSLAVATLGAVIFIWILKKLRK